MTEELYEALLFMMDGRKMRRKSPLQYFKITGQRVRARELNVMMEVKIDNLLITDFDQQYKQMLENIGKKKAKVVEKEVKVINGSSESGV